MAEQDANERFQKIDAAISRDIARRQRNRLISWALLFLAAAVAVYAVLAGRTETDLVAADLSSNVEFTAEIAASDSVRKAVAEETLKLSDNDTFANKLVESPALSRQIDTSIQNRFGNLAAVPEFHESVEDIAAGVSTALMREIEANRSAIESFEVRLLEISQSGKIEPGPIDSGDYSKEDLAKLVSAQNALETRLRREIEKLSRDLTELRAQVAKSQSTRPVPQDSQTTVGKFGRPHSYLLRENANTALSDLNLYVTLGQKSNGTVERVVFADTRGPIESATKANVRIGESFVVVDREGRRFEATLTYDQERFLAKDYVGLEMAPIHDPLP